MAVEELPVQVTPLPNGMKIAFRGKFHLQRELMDAEMDRVIKSKPALVVIDLSGVEFIASEGVGRLVIFRNRLVSGGGTVKTVGVSPRVLEIFALSRLLPVMNIETGGASA